MRLRAVWIIPITKDDTTPLFSRRFHTVEACCKSEFKDDYTCIPTDEHFVKALRVEVGLANGGEFVESRDRCSKAVLFPTFEIVVENDRILWPVVIQEIQGLIYCALPLITLEQYTQKQRSIVSLADIPGVSMAIEVLNGLAQCAPLTSNMTKLTPGLTLQLHQFISICMPFGSVITTDPSLVPLLIKSPGKGKAKQPVWNPVTQKTNSQITVHIKEEIRCNQFNHPEMKDTVDVYGTVLCKADVEGTSPEICISLLQPSTTNAHKGRLITSPAVSNIDYSANSTRLRFRSCNNQPICHYAQPHLTDPPIYGAYKLRMNNNLATISIKLQLMSGVKNNFQLLEVSLPLSLVVVSHIKPSPTIGSVSVKHGNTLVWNLGNKFPSKSLDATLNAVCKLKKLRQKQEQYGESIGWEQQMNSYAEVVFRISDYTLSGTRVDPQSITVSTTSKVKKSVSSECLSGVYRIWNSEGEVPSVPEEPTEEILKSI